MDEEWKNWFEGKERNGFGDVESSNRRGEDGGWTREEGGNAQELRASRRRKRREDESRPDGWGWMS